MVQPDFLERLIGFFDDPQLGFVQACQDYREWENSDTNLLAILSMKRISN